MAHDGRDVMLLWESAPVFSNTDPNFFLSLELEQRMGVMNNHVHTLHPAVV